MLTLIRNQASATDSTVELEIVEETEDHPGFELYLSLESERLHADGEDLFEALLNLRRQLEPRGIQILLNGSARNVWPSPMARSMGGGRLAYKMTLGHQARTVDLVDIFEHDPAVEHVAIREQEAFLEQWFSSLGAQEKE
jgi:hypothetical protein